MRHPPRLALLVCIWLAGCVRTQRTYTPFSRSWDPNFVKRDCRHTIARIVRRGRRNYTYLVCAPVPVPRFDVVRIRPLLSGEYLIGADMRRANLEDAHLANANLAGADLEDADLADANLYRARLRDADLVDANPTGADFTDADLTRAQLRGANLFRADLEGATLTQADVREAKWSATRCPDGTMSDRDGGSCYGHLSAKPTADGSPAHD